MREKIVLRRKTIPKIANMVVDEAQKKRNKKFSDTYFINNRWHKQLPNRNCY